MFAVVILFPLVVMPAVEVNAESSAPITFSSGLTLYSPVNTTYSSRFLNCSGSFTGPIDYEISLNYTVNGSYQGILPWKLNSTTAANYTIDWSFQLPQLPHGTNQLNIGIDQQLYSNAGTLINQKTEVNTVYFTVSQTLVTSSELILIISFTAIIVILIIVLLIYQRHRKTMAFSKGNVDSNIHSLFYF